VKEICRALIDARLGVRWRGLIRVAVVDEEVAGLMAESGCLEVLLGVESGDADMLKRMCKRVTPEQVLRGVTVLSRNGISTKSTFIVGFPGETERSIRNTVDLLNAYPTDGPAVHRYMFFLFAVLPLSEVASAESRAAHGLEGYGYRWKHATMDARAAAAHIVTMQDALKIELSPSYVLEVPELRELSIERIKRICVLRNRIARVRRGLLPGASEGPLWDELERELV
jgi:radical SAM superfamily enzyme YgiQ (UPF0313 family)